MIQRCCNREHPAYEDYGKQGVSVCDRWKNSFLNFINDMGSIPDGYSLDCISGAGNYEPFRFSKGFIMPKTKEKLEC